MFVGFSTLHSSLVPLVFNLRTGKILPQYHVIFDDTFDTVLSLPSVESLDKKWRRLFKLGREFYLDEEYDTDGELKTSHLPDLGLDWLDPVAAVEQTQTEGTAPQASRYFSHRCREFGSC